VTVCVVAGCIVTQLKPEPSVLARHLSSLHSLRRVSAVALAAALLTFATPRQAVAEGVIEFIVCLAQKTAWCVAALAADDPFERDLMLTMCQNSLVRCADTIAM
jgi:hypothetical protein